MKKILFINHNIEACGVYQYGKRLANILVKSTNTNFIYCELSILQQYIDICKTPVDAIIYNYHISTLSWLTNTTMQHKVPNIGIHHESHLGVTFDYIIDINCQDVPNSIFRPLLIYNNNSIINNIPVIGSFGFGFNNKGFDKIIKYVNEHFDEAIIRLNITSAHFTDHNDQTTKLCNSVKRKEGIKLIITHEFFTDTQLLDWLNSNTINIFLYDYMHGRGCASTIDYALSVNVPIGISDSYMFRHIYNDNICVYKTPIKDIITNGLRYLEQYKVTWTHNNLITKLENFIYKDILLINKMKNNTVLDDTYRTLLAPSINELFALVPDMMSRKIPRANVQQAFAFKYIKDHFDMNVTMICAGSHEDTCCAALQVLGYDITAIDPVSNYDLHTYCVLKNYPSTDVVFSVSVIEHVQDDDQFVNDMCKLLKPGGTCILTCDFNNSYKPGDPKPSCDYRFYTQQDLLVRFKTILDNNNCYIDGDVDYSAPNDFVYECYLYTFATLVFKKRI